MTLKEQLTNDMKDAMRAREMEKLQTIRFLLAEIKNYEIDHETVSETDLQKVVTGQVKKIKEAMLEFKNAGREDLVTAEAAKVAIMEKYLPQQLSDLELETIIGETLKEVGEVKNPGQLIGAVMKKTAGQADGKRVQEIINKLTAA